jgi:hypothetical protein
MIVAHMHVLAQGDVHVREMTELRGDRERGVEGEGGGGEGRG